MDKMRRHRVFLLCTVGLCVISFLHYYKALHYVSLLRELSAPYPIKSFIMSTGFFWRERGLAATPLSPERQEADPLRAARPELPVAPRLNRLFPPGSLSLSLESMGDLHTRSHQLQDDPTPYFARTKAGALCFRRGTEVATPKEPPGKTAGGAVAHAACVCRPGWHGPYCGVPTMFDLLHARFHELSQAVDLFIVCESNFTAYGEQRPLGFLQRLLNGTYDYVRHKLLYVFLDHFPEGGRQDGWIADDYLRTFLTRNGMSRVLGVRPDDVFVINDADEIPAHEALLFLKLFDGWTEPFALHMRKSLYGFFWKQFGSLEVISGCTVGMLRDVYDSDGIKLRRREYYTMPGFRKYENQTGHILVQWSVGSPFHFAGWHCSWCFTPEGIHFKLISAQNGDFPRWGDYEDKLDLNYIRQLIRTGGWFDGSFQEYPPADPKEHMYAPKYMLDHYDKYRYLLANPYSQGSQSGGG
uniref:Beta-1,4-mannosyl-glycoprotein 4-beta-N-acetylglucosaminyltransferase b n=1 Tax=Neogobius melanostomus TaxID=47308 RepID=A0A8C6S3C4_9GOBI